MFPHRVQPRPEGQPKPAPLTADAIRQVITDALLPTHFFAGPLLGLEWEHLPAEELPWEVFQGRLLDRTHTRQRRTFEAWNVHALEGGTRSAEPLLAVKLDLFPGQ